MKIPEVIKEQIMKPFKANNYQIYLVGGWVRDQVLGLTNYDLDFVTDMASDDVFALFIKFSGIKNYPKFGAVHFKLPPYEITITQMRKEFNYIENRYPKDLVWTSSIDEDVLRRDFTMNALYLSYEEKLLDPLGGIQDIQQGRIKMIGDPYKKFQEDHLRTLRCLRFFSEYSFKIERTTFDELILEPNLSLTDKKDEMIKILESFGLKQLISYFPIHFKNIFEVDEIHDELLKLPAQWTYRILLVYKSQPESLEKLLQAWHIKKGIQKHLLKLHFYLFQKSYALEEVFMREDFLLFYDYLFIKDQLEVDPFYSDLRLQIEAKAFSSIKDLAISGYDLKKLPIEPQDRSNILKKIFWYVLIGKLENKEEELKKELRRLANVLY